MNFSHVRVISEGLSAWTTGLRMDMQHEIRVSVSDPELSSECRRFMNTLVKYLAQSNRLIRHGETMNWGYWFVQFQKASDSYIDVWEYNLECTAFVPGATRTLAYWHEQSAVCRAVSASFEPPAAGELVVYDSWIG